MQDRLPQLQGETGVAGEAKRIPQSYKNSPHRVHCVPSEGEYEPPWKAKRVDKKKVSMGCTRGPEHT